MQGVAVWQQEQYLGPLDGCLIEGRHLKGDGSRAVDVPRGLALLPWGGGH
jgi:hypothetical protein